MTPRCPNLQHPAQSPCPKSAGHHSIFMDGESERRGSLASKCRVPPPLPFLKNNIGFSELRHKLPWRLATNPRHLSTDLVGHHSLLTRNLQSVRSIYLGKANPKRRRRGAQSTTGAADRRAAGPADDHYPPWTASRRIDASFRIGRIPHAALIAAPRRKRSRTVRPRYPGNAASAERRMEPVSLEGLPENALLLVDSAPIIYVLEDHPELASVFRPYSRHTMRDFSVLLSPQ